MRFAAYNRHVIPVKLGDIALGGGASVRADRRAVRHRERGARDRGSPARSSTSRDAPASRSSSRRRTTRRTARRSSRSAARGSTRACACSARSRRGTGVPILTDIHEPAQAAIAADVADVLQIPAFLCRARPICIVAAARTGSHRQHQEGPVSRARRRQARGREGRGGRQRRVCRHRARHELRLSQPRRRHAGVSDDARQPASRSCSTSRTACSCPAAATASRPAWRNTSSRSRRRASRAGVDGVFLEVHEEPARAKSDAQNALRLDLLEPLLRRLTAIDAIAKARGRRAARAMADLAARAQGPRDRSGRDPRAGRRVSTSGSTSAVELLRSCRGRVILTGMGKSGIICRKIAATLTSTGTAAFFLHPAEAIHGDLGVIQGDDVVVALSYSGETDEILRLLETIRRLGAKLIAITGVAGLDAGAGGRRRARLQRHRGSVPDEPGADREHDGGARDRRRARDDAARRQGLPRGGFREPAPGRQARQAADARRER